MRKALILILLLALAAACAPAPQRPVVIDEPMPFLPQVTTTPVEKFVTMAPAEQHTPDVTQTPSGVDEASRVAAADYLRGMLGAPQLELAFKTLDRSPNAVNHPALVFVDAFGNTYYFRTDTLKPIEFTLTQPFQTAPGGAKTADDLRAAAETLANENSEKFGKLKSQLAYTEGMKGENNFFRWEMPGTDVGGMPAILQIGLKQDGTLFSYLNSLDFLP